jgi:hypothetical protein
MIEFLITVILIAMLLFVTIALVQATRHFWERSKLGDRIKISVAYLGLLCALASLIKMSLHL